MSLKTVFVFNINEVLFKQKDFSLRISLSKTGLYRKLMSEK